jgi:hypothetical protein
MKRLTVALLVLALFTPSVFAQSVEQKERLRVFAGWLGIVRGAERNYKTKHGRYGDLTDLRRAHLLDGLVFESDSSRGTHDELETNFVRKSTLFQVRVSEDGQHFWAVIGEDCVGLDADDTGGGRWYCRPHPLVLPHDGPEGPIIAIPG